MKRVNCKIGSTMRRATLVFILLGIATFIIATPAFAGRDPGAGPASDANSMELYDYANNAQSRVNQNGYNNQYADGMNLYQYVKRNPITHQDSSGLYDIIIGPNGEPIDPNTLPPKYPERPTIVGPQLQVGNGTSCCKEKLDNAIKLANRAMRRGKCEKWFIKHGIPANETPYRVNFHPKWKPACLVGIPMWTYPLTSSIGVCSNACEFEASGIASLLIHEVAHHYCPIISGSEKCAESAQEACVGEITGE